MPVTYRSIGEGAAWVLAQISGILRIPSAVQRELKRRELCLGCKVGL